MWYVYGGQWKITMSFKLLFIVIYFQYCYFHTWKKMSSDNKLCVAFDWMKNWRDLFIDQFFYRKQACKKKDTITRDGDSGSHSHLSPQSPETKAKKENTSWVSCDPLKLCVWVSKGSTAQIWLLNKILLPKWTFTIFWVWEGRGLCVCTKTQRKDHRSRL